MRRIMMTIGGTIFVLGTALTVNAQDKAPVQVPAQAPAQAPAKPMQAPMQAPIQKIAPMQAPAQAPTQKHTQAPTQAHVQKGQKMAADEMTFEGQTYAMSRGMFRRYR